VGETLGFLHKHESEIYDAAKSDPEFRDWLDRWMKRAFPKLKMKWTRTQHIKVKIVVVV